MTGGSDKGAHGDPGGARGKKGRSAGARDEKSGGAPRRRDDLPRRLGDVLTPALDRLATGDEARAYSAWARAVGDPVTGGTRPKAFRRGQLTIECASSVWANELTYLGPQILRRMDEVAPGHPVARFRFIVGRVPSVAAAEDAPGPAPGDPPPVRPTVPERRSAGQHEGLLGQESEGPTAKKNRQRERPAPAAGEAARVQAEGVHDERLRAAIEAALRRSSQEPPEAPARGTPSG